MNPPPRYSSLAAFLAHYRMLARADKLTADEKARLAEMTVLLEVLEPAQREALQSQAGGEVGRHRERALRRLRRELTARGTLCA